MTYYSLKTEMLKCVTLHEPFIGIKSIGLSDEASL